MNTINDKINNIAKVQSTSTQKIYAATVAQNATNAQKTAKTITKSQKMNVNVNANANANVNANVNVNANAYVNANAKQ